MHSLLRPRWSLVVAGAWGPPLLVAAVVTTWARSTRASVALLLVVVIVAVAVTESLRRRTLTLLPDGFMVQRARYRMSAHWADVVLIERRRFGLLPADVLVVRESTVAPVTLRGRPGREVPAAVAASAADRRLVVSFYDAHWRTGVVGDALRAEPLVQGSVLSSCNGPRRGRRAA